MIGALVFDLDGTLIDSIPDVRAALNRALAEEGRRSLALDEVRAMIGDGARITIERAMATTGDPGSPDVLDAVTDRYMAHYLADPAGHTVIYPGVVSILQHFKAAGITMGICTNKPRVTTLAALDALGLAPFFAAVLCGDAVPHPKPDGRHVLAVLEHLGAEPAAAAMVGDSEPDIAAARDAGVASVAVTWGYAKADPAALGADAVIDDARALPRVLVGLLDGRTLT